MSTPSQPQPPKPLPPIPALDSRGLPQGYGYQPEWEITPREVRDLLASKRRGQSDVLLVDCRREDEWNTAKIDGAVLLPLAEVPMRLDELEGPDGERDRPIVVHCHGGRRSLKATALLRAAGFSDVRSMAGGIELWSIDVDPSVPRYV